MAEIALSPQSIRTKLSHACESAGSQSAFAVKHGIAVSQICETLAGRREPSESIINALGYVRVVRYVPRAQIEGGNHAA